MEEKTAQEYAQDALRIIKLCNTSGAYISKELEYYVSDLEDICLCHSNNIISAKLLYVAVLANLINGEIFRKLLGFLLVLPISSTVKIEELKGYIRPLSYDELYYALDFLDEDKRFLLLSTLPYNKKTQLLNAYHQQEKQKFVTIASNLESDVPCYAFFNSILSVKDFNSKILSTYDYLVNKDDFSMAISEYPFYPSIRKFNKRITEVDKKLAHIHDSMPQILRSCVQPIPKCEQPTPKSCEQSAPKVLGTIDLAALNFNRTRHSKSQRILFERVEEDFLQDSILALKKLIYDTSIYIQYISTFQGVSLVVKEQLRNYIKTYDFIFDGEDFNDLLINDTYSTRILNKLAELCLKMVRNHIEIKEKETRIEEPTPNVVVSGDMKANDVQISNECVVKHHPTNLGHSPYIDKLVKNEGEKYHLFLGYLYDYLTAKTHLGEEPCLSKPLIDCTKEDFMYVLGDTSIDEASVSDVPAINWIEIKLRMIAFFDVLYINLTTITRQEKKCCYLYNGKNVQLSENRKKSESYKSYWEHILKSCKKVVDNQTDR